MCSRGHETPDFAIDSRFKVRGSMVRDGQNSCPERSLAIETSLVVGDLQHRGVLADQRKNFPLTWVAERGFDLLHYECSLGNESC